MKTMKPILHPYSKGVQVIFQGACYPKDRKPTKELIKEIVKEDLKSNLDHGIAFSRVSPVSGGAIGNPRAPHMLAIQQSYHIYAEDAYKYLFKHGVNSYSLDAAIGVAEVIINQHINHVASR